MRRSTVFAAMCFGIAALTGSPASAANYRFNFSGLAGGIPISASGLIGTSDVLNQFGGYSITSISGMANGNSIVGLDANTVSTTNAPLFQNGDFIYDNSIFANTSYVVSGAGIAFSTSQSDFNLGAYDPPTFYLLSGPAGGGASVFATGTLDLVNVNPLPESETWAMMIVGFAAIGYASRRKTGGTRIKFA